MAPRAWRPRAGTPPLIALPCAPENPAPQNPPLRWRSTQLPNNSLLFKILVASYNTRIDKHCLYYTYIAIFYLVLLFLSLSLPYPGTVKMFWKCYFVWRNFNIHFYKVCTKPMIFIYIHLHINKYKLWAYGWYVSAYGRLYGTLVIFRFSFHLLPRRFILDSRASLFPWENPSRVDRSPCRIEWSNVFVVIAGTATATTGAVVSLLLLLSLVVPAYTFLYIYRITAPCRRY